MKFLKRIISFTLFIIIVSLFAILVTWLAAPDKLEPVYNFTIAKITGKRYQNTFADNIKDVEKDSVAEHSKRHADPTYVCPMHPQIVKDEPGNCPICGMDLVKKESKKTKPPKQNKQKKIKYWVAPMDANYRRDEPGKSPMGMDLIPVYEEDNDDSDEENADDFPKITINATTAQNMGIRVATVKVHELSRAIKTIGSVTYNEDTLHHVHPRAKGWVEKVNIKSLGDPVSKGETLLEFYSPEIVAAQKDLIIALRHKSLASGKGASLTEASKTRLRDLNVPETIIQKIIKTRKSQSRIPVIAQHDGVVTRIGIRDGMYITPASELYTIADLSTVWVIVDVFEHQLTWIKVGDKAEIQVQGVPGETWIGKVDYIYPELNPKTRTLRVRLKIAAPKQLLKPNMFADVALFAGGKRALTVPSEAVIYYGNSTRMVKVVDEKNKRRKFQPVKVKTGIKTADMVEISEGLIKGDKILVSGQFMIDSESNLQASFRRLSGEGAENTQDSDAKANTMPDNASKPGMNGAHMKTTREVSEDGGK